MREGTRVGAVMTAIRQRIATRAMASGDRLPSIRGLAATLGVSPSTVVDAYDRLAAEGLIRARPGSGFYATSAAPPLVIAESGLRRDRAIDPLWVSRQSLDAGADAVKPGCGWLPAEWMPQAAIRHALRRIAGQDAEVVTDYGGTGGPPALRRMLTRRLAEQGVDAAPEQILVTGSGTQAMDLLCRFLLRPGDAVLVDDPCYFNFLALLRAHRVEVHGVPYTPTGPDADAFAQALATHRPRLYVTNSAIHNPTGATISHAVAYRLLAAAQAHDVTIVEDDIFGDFEPDLSPRLAALDGLSRVVRIGSFSKTLSASLRCGHIAARRDWIEGLIDLQVATTFGGANPVAADVTLRVLAEGSYRRHLDGLRRRLARAMAQTAAPLRALGLTPWTIPRGGFHLWCRLPEGLDSTEIARLALAEGVVLAPGNVFSASQSCGGFLRFNVAQCADPRVFAVLGRAMATAGRADGMGPERRAAPFDAHPARRP